MTDSTVTADNAATSIPARSFVADDAVDELAAYLREVFPGNVVGRTSAVQSAIRYMREQRAELESTRLELRAANDRADKRDVTISDMCDVAAGRDPEGDAASRPVRTVAKLRKQAEQLRDERDAAGEALAKVAATLATIGQLVELGQPAIAVMLDKVKAGGTDEQPVDVGAALLSLLRSMGGQE